MIKLVDPSVADLLLRIVRMGLAIVTFKERGTHAYRALPTNLTLPDSVTDTDLSINGASAQISVVLCLGSLHQRRYRAAHHFVVMTATRTFDRWTDCPRCGATLESGLLLASRGIYWDKKVHWHIVGLEKLLSMWASPKMSNVQGQRCRSCRLVLFHYV